MSIEYLREQLNKKQDDKEKLISMRAHLQAVEGHVDSIAKKLKEAALSIEKAGGIGNKPFDDHKTEEANLKYENIHSNVETAISDVDADIKAIDEKIVELNNSIAYELSLLEKAKEDEKAKDNTTKPNNNNRRDAQTA